MANILAITTAALTALGVKLPSCLGTSDPAALQNYAKRAYNPNRDRYSPAAMHRVTNEVETQAANQSRQLSAYDANQLAHSMLDSLRKAGTAEVQGLMAAAPGGVPDTDPIALAAAQSASDFGVVVSDAS